MFSGGTGTPKLLRGLLSLIPEKQLTVVANTGDDIWISGNLVCPDIDTVIYTLAGVTSDRWWGIRDDTFLTHETLVSRGHEERLNIGEFDRATHIFRSDLLRRGLSLTEATFLVCASFSVSSKVLPMTNDFVPTIIQTDEGEMHIQDFLIKHKQQPAVMQVNCETSAMTKEVKTALAENDAVVIGPSNPISSIGPILRVNGIREALKDRFVVAVSPIVRTEPVSGPARKFMESIGLPVSSVGVAEFYSDFLDILIVDNTDFAVSTSDLPDDVRVMHMNTIMTDRRQSKALAAKILQLLAQHC
ncbi:MAG: 2-phospho-L-lactate transferase [Halobacteriota archaeon]